jgi:CrcB protein
MIRDILLVGAGSALGGIARFLVNRGVTYIFSYPFPLATFLVNISGSFLIGYLYSSSLKHQWLTTPALLFLVTGICGGFTTFSAFSYENIMLIRNGQAPLSVIYILASLVMGIGAALLGFWAGK